MNWLTNLWHRICFNAWTYARKREISRRGSDDGVAAIPELSAALEPVQRRIIANEASQLLSNKHFREAFDAVAEALEAQAQACNADDLAKTQRVVIAKQILTGIRREIMRKAEDGYMAEVEIAELERRRAVRRFAR